MSKRAVCIAESFVESLITTCTGDGNECVEAAHGLQ